MKLNVLAKKCFTKFTIEILEEINTSQKINFKKTPSFRDFHRTKMC